MNRRERRAAAARNKAAASSAPVDIAALIAEATGAYEQGRAGDAETICTQILAHAPAHTASLNLLGVLYHASGRYRLAVKMLSKAIAFDDMDVVSHYNIGVSYQALDQRADASSHFKKAIALGMAGRDVESGVMQKTVVAECVKRITEKLSLRGGSESVFGERDIATIASDAFIRCALESRILSGVALEFFLTHLRSALLRIAHANAADPAKVDDDVVGLFCALARQCFMNEYVFAQGEEEAQQAGRSRDLLLQQLSAGGDISPLLLAAAAAYFPLYSLAPAKSLLAREWPPGTAELLRQQLREPLEEAEDRGAIPALTAIDDRVSMEVMQQYEENPYPRWTIDPIAARARDAETRVGAAGGRETRPCREILVAGCGTGEQALIVAQQYPAAHVTAVDLSRTSLAYARRKTREHGVANVEYAQADILKFGAIGRSFDRIEATGVLHHLADPKAGWRVLLSLLRPNGIMRVGLYSEAARRPVVDARVLIAKHGYRATAEDIRAFRQTIIRNWNDPRWKMLISTTDFYSVSGCRDILFNVMEHRFTVPEIAAFLNENGLSFLGFELDPLIVGKFREQFPDVEAPANLDYWNAFEAAHPRTFEHMYTFSVQKNEQASH